MIIVRASPSGHYHPVHRGIQQGWCHGQADGLDGVAVKFEILVEPNQANVVRAFWIVVIRMGNRSIGKDFSDPGIAKPPFAVRIRSRIVLPQEDGMEAVAPREVVNTVGGR